MARISLSLFLLSAFSCVLLGSVSATEHIVGGDFGWAIPPNSSFYQDWAQSRKFVVGDTLVFVYKTSIHSVIEVSKSNFEACTQYKVVEMYYKGPTTIELTTPGDHFFHTASLARS